MIGIERFRAAFAPHHYAVVLIGGAACHLSMSAIGAPFRVSHNLCIVLMPAHDRTTAGIFNSLLHSYAR